MTGLIWILPMVGGLCAACRPMVQPGQSAELRVVATGVPLKALPTRFVARVTPDSGAASQTGAEVQLRLIADVLEYSMRVRNPLGQALEEAVILMPEEGRAGAAERPVAILFTDGRFRDRHLEMRGTVQVLPSVSPVTLAEELQRRPGTFRVVLTGGGTEGLHWEGRLTAVGPGR